MRYEAVNAMLLNEFLKEHRKVEQLEEQIATLTAGLQKVSAQVEMVTLRRKRLWIIIGIIIGTAESRQTAFRNEQICRVEHTILRRASGDPRVDVFSAVSHSVRDR